ncbi:hypothetical protein D9615_009351 [Tricholomella constricta]|uniref:Uncharacterized protein n=1 Tax=Tricholomella constricta TaxID=117010 RepID=A0A8H5H2S8_9AGAR|nr:hypothetical protein D9615_009351 [Tricholomella constricta]
MSTFPVRKNAQENKDKLGPHWSSWVGKAIHKLEEEGILAASQSPAGNLTITPAGKKVITAARQSIAHAINASPSAVPDDLVWKHITQHSPNTRGLKRGRRSSIRPLRDEDADARDLPPSSFSTTRSKRARLSTVPVSPSKKPIYRMNKAEVAYSLASRDDADLIIQLQVELRALQKEHENEQWLRESSPLTDFGDDDAEEINQLRQELKERKEEIERIRRELAEAKGEARLSVSQYGSPHRLPTPNIDDAPTSSMRPIRSVPTQSMPLNAITRTQSGSLISLVSKQPTPAPSSPGTENADLPMSPVSSPVDDFTMHEDNDDRVPPWLHTPSGTMTSEATSNGHALKVIQLERDLAARTAATHKLEAQFSQLQTETQQSLLERNNRLSILSADIARLKEDASTKALVLDQQTAELTALHTVKRDLELTCAGLERDVHERDVTVQSWKTDLEKTLVELHRLQAALDAAEQLKVALTSRVAHAENEASTLRSELNDKEQNMDLQLKSHQTTEESLEKQVQSLLATTAALEEKVEQLQSSEKAMSMSLAKVTNEYTLVSTKLRDAEDAHESLHSQLTSALDENSALAGTLKDSETLVAALTSQVSTLEDSKSQDNANIEQLTVSLTAAQKDVATLRQQVTAAEFSASTLQLELGLSKQAKDELTTRLAAIVDERAGLSSQLGEALTTISASASSLDQLKEALATTTGDLNKSKTAAAELQANLNATTDELKAREDQLRALEEAVAKRDQELRRLAGNLSVAESMAEKFRAEAAASETKVEELCTQLAAAHGLASAAQELLSSTKASHAVECEKQVSAISGLEDLLRGAQAQIENLRSELDTVRLANVQLQAQVNGQSIELGETRVNLDSARQQASRLEFDLLAASAKVLEVEEELSELKVAKEADEASIENLKEMFSSLRESQMRSLAELDSKVVSTKSSPAPKRRSTRTTSNKAPPPFKLT